MTGRQREAYLNYGVLVFLSLVVALPTIGLLALAFHPDRGGISSLLSLNNLTLDTLHRVWVDGGFSTALRNSAIVAVSATTISLIASTTAGYAFGILQPRWSSPLFYVFLSGLIIPLEAYVVPLYYQLQSMHLLDTLPGLILPLSAQMLPFGIFWMRSQFRAVPQELLDAAYVDGASSFAVLRHVLLPLVRPSVASLCVLTFMWTWSDFLLSLFVISTEGRRTAPLQLGLFAGVHVADVSGLAGAALIVSLPVLVVYVLLQRRLIDGLMEGGVK